MCKTSIFIFFSSEFHFTSLPAASYLRLSRDGWQCPETIFLFLLSCLLKPCLGGAYLSLEEALEFHLILSHHHTANKFYLSFQKAAFKEVFGGSIGHVFWRKTLVEEEERKRQDHIAVFKSQFCHLSAVRPQTG